MSTSPYKMSISITLEDSAGVVMSDTRQTYANLSYDNVVELQGALLELAKSLGEKGAARKRGKQAEK